MRFKLPYWYYPEQMHLGRFRGTQLIEDVSRMAMVWERVEDDEVDRSAMG